MRHMPYTHWLLPSARKCHKWQDETKHRFWLLRSARPSCGAKQTKVPASRGFFPTCVIAPSYWDGDSRHGEAVVLPTYSWLH